jgi:hypothetical protein
MFMRLQSPGKTQRKAGIARTDAVMPFTGRAIVHGFRPALGCIPLKQAQRDATTELMMVEQQLDLLLAEFEGHLQPDRADARRCGKNAD